MNNLTTSSSKSLTADRRSNDDVAAMRNRMIRDYPAAPEILLEPMPIDIRRRLETRRLVLEQALAPAARAEHSSMAKAIASMLGAFAANSSGSAEAIVAKYVHVLADYPAWATVQACQMIEHGEVEEASLDFRPSAPRVRDATRAVLAPWLEELSNVRAVLNAPALEPENAAMRDRLGRLFSQFAADFRVGKFRQSAAQRQSK